jgi:hypothetical protein
MIKLYLSLAILTLLSCSTTYRLTSKPQGATVFSGTTNLGTTPIELTLDQITEKLGEGGQLRLELTGYFPLTIWLPDTGNNINASINLNPLKLSNMRAEKNTLVDVPRLKINSLTDLLLDYQSKLLKGEQLASADVIKIVNSNPSLGSAYFLAALALLNENKTAESTSYANKATRFSPLELDFHILLESQKKPEGTN